MGDRPAAETQQPARIFLSYSRRDQDRVAKLVAVLERRGYAIWWDRHIDGGASFSREIETELKRADAVVVAWSAASVESDWVRDEAAWGRDHSRLVPVLLDRTEAPIGFRQVQAINLAGWSGRANAPEIETLVRSLAHARRPGAPADPVPAAATPRPTPKRGLTLAAGVAVVLALASGAYAIRGRLPMGEPDKPGLVVDSFQTVGDTLPATTGSGVRDEALIYLGPNKWLNLLAEKDGGAGNFHLSGRVEPGPKDTAVVFAELRAPGSGAPVWNGRFEGARSSDRLTRVLAEPVAATAGCIVGGMNPKLSGGAGPEAIPALVRYCREGTNPIGTQESQLDKLRELVVAMPKSAYFMAELGGILGDLSLFRPAPEAEKNRIEGAAIAQRANELEPNSAYTLNALAVSRPPSDYLGREQLHLKALAANPTDCGCEYQTYSAHLARVGRMKDSQAAVRRTLDMVPDSWPAHGLLAERMAMNGGTREALALLDEAQKRWPDVTFLQSTRFKILTWAGDYRGALKAIDVEPDNPVKAERVRLFEALMSGDIAQQQRSGAQFLALAQDQRNFRPSVLFGLTLSGQDREALALAERMITARPIEMRVLFEPSMAKARQLPEFEALVTRLGLVDYWKTSGNLPDFCTAVDAPALCARLKG